MMPMNEADLVYDCDANGLKKLVKLNDNIVKIA